MTNSFEEYLEINSLDKMSCNKCGVHFGYGIPADFDDFLRCDDCTKKDYEENK